MSRLGRWWGRPERDESSSPRPAMSTRLLELDGVAARWFAECATPAGARFVASLHWPWLQAAGGIGEPGPPAPEVLVAVMSRLGESPDRALVEEYVGLDEQRCQAGADGSPGPEGVHHWTARLGTLLPVDVTGLGGPAGADLERPRFEHDVAVAHDQLATALGLRHRAGLERLLGSVRFWPGRGGWWPHAAADPMSLGSLAKATYERGDQVEADWGPAWRRLDDLISLPRPGLEPDRWLLASFAWRDHRVGGLRGGVP